MPSLKRLCAWVASRHATVIPRRPSRPWRFVVPGPLHEADRGACPTHDHRASRHLALGPVPRLDAPRSPPGPALSRIHARSPHACTALRRARRCAPHHRGGTPCDAARSARPGHGRDRAAYDRREPGRRRQHVVGGHRQSSMRDGGDAALRQAVGYPRPAHHDADRDQRLWGGFARLCAGALDADADSRARAAGTRQRRPDAAGADHHRRRGVAARSSALSGLHLVDLHRVDRRRPDSRRLHRRASALVVDLLAQPAALRGGLSPDPQCAAAAAAARPPAQARHTWRSCSW